MAISQCLPTSFKVDLLSGQQNFSALSGGPNTFKIALYTSSATLDATTTSYTGTTNEITGTGYTAGGKTLTISVAPTSSGTTAYISFSNAVWTASTFCKAWDKSLWAVSFSPPVIKSSKPPILFYPQIVL